MDCDIGARAHTSRLLPSQGFDFWEPQQFFRALAMQLTEPVNFLCYGTQSTMDNVYKMTGQ